jgi:hypothetical protein
MGDRGPSRPDTPLRRLTRSELRNTLRDLLGVTLDGGSALPADPRAAVFRNQSDLFTTDETTVDALRTAMGKIVDRALDPANAPAVAGWLACDPGKQGAACVRPTIAALARRAWRRPVDGGEVDAMVTLAQAAVSAGDDWRTGLSLSLNALLLSPNFLFRVERSADAGGPRALDPHELATRLSYFVWSSMPDDALFARADDGTLVDSAVLHRELQRMLADPKASSLRADFAGQWLDVDELDADATNDGGLATAMKQETFALLGDFLDRDVDFLDVLDAGYSYANATLAPIYGLKGLGAAMGRVSLDGVHRTGLLTQASVLTTSALPTRSSPTRRGKWLLSRMLCAPPPPPPANANTEIDSAKNTLPDPDSATLREKLEAHRTSPTCRACHALIDPPGYAFEHYDQTGAWRDTEPTKKGARAIDATGSLDGVGAFDGAVELSKRLKAAPAVTRCVTELVYTFALGRAASAPGDQAAIDELADGFSRHGRRFRDLVAAVAGHPAFLTRGGAR